MLATSTHDTKRSEDVRARLNILSEMPKLWSAFVMRARRMNRGKKITISDGRTVPDANEEYLLYQTLVGMWPAHAGPADRGELIQRLQDYITKAVHEAKVNLSWVNQCPEYVDALRNFIAAILTGGSRTNGFVEVLQAFLEPIAYFGAINSLAQTTLKLTSPGNPDVYQGTELWDLSLVDPDNRRPVDFALRRELLASLRSSSGNTLELCRELIDNWQDGRIKMWTTLRALEFRREHPELFHEGSYVALEAAGMTRNLCTFGRVHHGRDAALPETAIVAVPRFAYSLMAGKSVAPLADIWGDSAIRLPAEGPQEFVNVFTGETVRAQEGSLLCRELFRHFPMALLYGH
jgi:(1->4)-alpha-D-glucan 1-alpha-D-glucosylmutase